MYMACTSKNAFLNSKLDYEIFMLQPERFVNKLISFYSYSRSLEGGEKILTLSTRSIQMILWFHCAKDLSIVAYCDADWASSFDRKPKSGYVVFVGRNSVFWKSKKQVVVDLSSTETEIIAATETVLEIIWI